MAVQPITDLPAGLGLLVQIAFNKGIFNQIPDDVREWEQIYARRVNDPLARTSRYAIQTGMGPAAVQMRNPGTSHRRFPKPQPNESREIEFALKEWNATISLPIAIVQRAMTAKDKKYLEPIAYETTSKAAVIKRVLTADWYGDGTGVRGQIGSTTLVASDDGVSGSRPLTITFQLSNSDSARGFAGWFEYDDLVQLISQDGTSRRFPSSTLSAAQGSTALKPASGAYYVWRVVDRNHRLNQVKLALFLFNSASNSYTPVARTGGDTLQQWATASLATTDVFYRWDQPTYPDLTSISDYGSASEVSPGLETFSADDGRVLDGVAREGILAGTRLDCGGDPIAYPHFNAALSKVKHRVGENKYNYKKACMSAYTHDTLVNEREAQRYFNLYTDNKRGTTFYGFVHRNSIVEAYVSEFCRNDRIFILPEDKGQTAGKVLEYHGTDTQRLQYPGSPEWHLNTADGGGHTNDINQYMMGMGRFVCKQSAAILCLHNFTIS